MAKRKARKKARKSTKKAPKKRASKKPRKKTAKKVRRNARTSAKKSSHASSHHKSYERRRLYRSRSNRVVLGICGGLSDYFDSDPVLVRVLAILIMLVTGIIPFIIAYLIAGVVIPER